MNKQDNELKRREVVNQIRYSNRVGNMFNVFRSYMSENKKHIKLKFELWLKLREAGYDVICEPIFASGIRMDLLAFKDGFWINYEILCSETEKQLNEKIKKYPNIPVIPIESMEDIDKIELD